MGSPGVVERPPSPDYIPGPEATYPITDYVPGPEAPPHLFTYHSVPEPEYPEFCHLRINIQRKIPEMRRIRAEDPSTILLTIGDDDEEDEGGGVNHLAPADSTVVTLPALWIIPESCLPPRKRPRLASPTPIYEVGRLQRRADNDAPNHPGCPISRSLTNGITDEWDGTGDSAIEDERTTTIDGRLKSEYYLPDSLTTTFDQETTIMPWFDGGMLERSDLS
ncbi:hypothetical protein Tco_0533200 [Tanacetum coccineum]